VARSRVNVVRPLVHTVAEEEDGASSRRSKDRCKNNFPFNNTRSLTVAALKG
jgi:hypothetical protein